jgi:putative transposase
LEMSIWPDHIHLVTMMPPKISVVDYCAIVKGRTAIRVFNKYRDLEKKAYWDNHFWIKGYCVDTVGLDSEMIRKYVKYQHTQERKMKTAFPESRIFLVFQGPICPFCFSGFWSFSDCNGLPD